MSLVWLWCIWELFQLVLAAFHTLYQKMLVFLSCDDKYCKLDLYPWIPIYTCCARQIHVFHGFSLQHKNSLIITLLIIIVYIISDIVEVMENAMNSFINYTCILVDIFGAICVIFIRRPESVIRLGKEKHAIPFFVDLYFLHCWGHIHIYVCKMFLSLHLPGYHRYMYVPKYANPSSFSC